MNRILIDKHDYLKKYVTVFELDVGRNYEWPYQSLAHHTLAEIQCA